MLGSNSSQKAQNLKSQDCLDLSALSGQRAADSLTNKPKIISGRGFGMPHIPRAAAHIPILMRVVVLALSWHAGPNFDVIAIKIHINGGNNTSPA